MAVTISTLTLTSKHKRQSLTLTNKHKRQSLELTNKHKRQSLKRTNEQKRQSLKRTPQLGAADAEIKVPSGENTELKRSPFKAWSTSVYSHTCYAYCRGFLSCLFLHFWSIHLHFFQNLSRFFPVLAVANIRFLCRPAE